MGVKYKMAEASSGETSRVSKDGTSDTPVCILCLGMAGSGKTTFVQVGLRGVGGWGPILEDAGRFANESFRINVQFANVWGRFVHVWYLWSTHETVTGCVANVLIRFANI